MANNDAVLNFKPAPDEFRVLNDSLVAAPLISVELSVVIPTYNGEGCLNALYERLTLTLQALSADYEIIFVEDCGQDKSWEVLTQIAQNDERVVICQLSKNFGQQIAITAGLSKAIGKWTVVMDCDLQDPPELIATLYQTAMQGFDIVYTSRKQRATSVARRIASKTYFAIVNVFQQTNAAGKYGAFTIISAKVRDAFLEFSDVNRHYVMILNWLGFASTEVEYEQADRYAGKSSYGLYSLLRLAVEGVFFRTTILLKIIVCLGFFVSFVGACFSVWAVVEYCIRGALPGWTSLTVSTLLLSGMSLISQGIVGLYVGEIFNQVKRRPLFLISKQYSKRQIKIDNPSRGAFG